MLHTPHTPHERFKTYKNVFDEHSERALFKLASQGHFDELVSPITLGKEANIFTAWNEREQRTVIVKIYRLETGDFNRLYDSIKFDPRFSRLKRQRRKIIFAWCKREFRNLMIARDAGIRCPMPRAFLDNILVMDFIGDEYAAPKVKDQIPKDINVFYAETMAYLQRLAERGLVHGDLSEYNILNHKEKPVFIDFAQATPVKSINAFQLVSRDIANLTRFFKKHGASVMDPELFKKKMIEKIKKQK